MSLKSTTRFSNRVEEYARWRPGYPREVVGILTREIGFSPDWVVADVGSGTGISAELFLREGNAVYGVEPNAPMRHAADRLLASYPKFHSVDGTAEATTLDDASVDCVLAAQAFHWFDPVKAGREFQRILRPPAWTVLAWNSRRIDSTPFLRDYETLLNRYGTDYRQVRHRNVDEAALAAIFASTSVQKRCVDNSQELTLEGLKGRLLSSSYVPAEGEPGHAEMLLALEAIFRQHHKNGVVRLEYDTEVYFGQLR